MPRVYIVGRSRESADRSVGECGELNSGGAFEFIKADTSLLKSVNDSLLLGEASRQAPNVSFAHMLPGVVRSDIQRDAQGLGMSILIKVTSVLQPLVETPPAPYGNNSSGVYSMDVKEESSPPKVEEVLAQFKDGTAENV
ncbi:hypothetical protein GGR53DRAFT_469259 [Hypoxylon sp. FL1150]|nr:hypothetical protein GGR53DRAFT_469259 [Hypoxylon sp. FL1150]